MRSETISSANKSESDKAQKVLTYIQTTIALVLLSLSSMFPSLEPRERDAEKSMYIDKKEITRSAYKIQLR